MGQISIPSLEENKLYENVHYLKKEKWETGHFQFKRKIHTAKKAAERAAMKILLKLKTSSKVNE
jgi:hypothetical protein